MPLSDNGNPNGIRPVILAVLDGIGLAESSAGNAVSSADAPFLHTLLSDTVWPCRSLLASGRAVGLPVGQMGNSEVGHLNIGAGRVVNQELTRIDDAIEDGSFFNNPVLLDALAACRKTATRLHLIGLLSDGGVHSMDSHFQALTEMAASLGVRDMVLHAFLDGRDVAPNSGQSYVLAAESHLSDLMQRYPGLNATIASIGGRYYGMDRDQRWERVKVAWQAIVAPFLPEVLLATGQVASELVSQSYLNAVYDEFMIPTAIDQRGVADGDVVIFFNFRPDRARELTRAMVDPDFSGFSRTVRPEVRFVTLTDYDPEFAGFGVEVAFAKETLRNVLAEHVSLLGLTQCHIAETEKYAHVTFFFNGGVEDPFPGEIRTLIPSPKIATYDLKPEMSAPEVTEVLINAIRAGLADLYILNYANGDMVGHTGVLSAARLAVAAVDRCLQQLAQTVLEVGGVLLVTADHGNAEMMVDSNGDPWTAHTVCPVPLVLVSSQSRAGFRQLDLNREGEASLADVAPTILDLMELPIPSEFSGESLLLRLNADK
jgi:2,3-bisphosphoglycerate-independent phosphoglycerate mutase